MKNLISVFITIIILSFASVAQVKHPKAKISDFSNLKGCWVGTLTYLDYTSNKPFSMSAELIAKDPSSKNVLTYLIRYPTEPGANATDSICISSDGIQLNKDSVKTVRKKDKKTFEINEAFSVDGNDNRPAIIRHTYMLSDESYIVKKEVKFLGEKNWLLRNEYNFKRISCP